MGKPAVNSADTLASDISRFWKKQTFDQLDPEEITIPERFRVGISEEAVVSLMASIQKIGLQSPITVRMEEDDDGDPLLPILVAGRHRLEAYIRLKIPSINCVLFEGSE